MAADSFGDADIAIERRDKHKTCGTLFTMLLPVGSEPGAYEVQLLDSDLKSRASAPGTVDVKDYVTTLQTMLDLATITSGSYQLAIRRTGQEWQLFVEHEVLRPLAAGLFARVRLRLTVDEAHPDAQNIVHKTVE